jgi:hypothetical protein
MLAHAVECGVVWHIMPDIAGKNTGQLLTVIIAVISDNQIFILNFLEERKCRKFSHLKQDEF